MATACRFLCYEGAKVIFQEPVFFWGSEPKVLAFLCFIQAEGLSRCSYLRNLITIIQISENVANILQDIVPRMSNLAGLFVRGCHLFEPYPYLVHTFASLRSVKTLILNEAGPRSCELLRMFQSELVAADVNFDFSTHSSAALSHPFHLLQRSASTLRRLAYTSSGHPDIDNTASQYPQIIYPEVRNLVLDRSGVVPNLTSYIQALPNVVDLEVYGMSSILDEYLASAYLKDKSPR